MIRRNEAIALFALFALAACGGERAAEGPALPQLPPLALSPRIDELKRIGAEWTSTATDAVRNELQEYADIALQLVETDERTARRAERALLESEHAPLVLEPKLKHENPAVRSRAAWLLGRSGRTVARDSAGGGGIEALAAAHSRAIAKLSADIAAAIRSAANRGG